jgi:hypothetical protein
MQRPSKVNAFHGADLSDNLTHTVHGGMFPRTRISITTALKTCSLTRELFDHASFIFRMRRVIRDL